MLPLGRFGTWIITITMVNYACSGIALAIPAPLTHTDMDPDSKSSNFRFLGPRADLDVNSVDGMFDSSSLSMADVEPVLPPVKEVLQAMMNQPSGSLSSTTQPSPSVASLSGQYTPSITATSVSPPKTGPGIVLLSSTVLPGFSTTGRSPESTSRSGNSTTASDSSTDSGGGASSHKVLILGTIIGGIVFVTIVLFFVLDPSISASIRDFFGSIFTWRPFNGRNIDWKNFDWRTTWAGKKDQGISHIAEPSFLVERGSTARVFGGMNPLRYSSEKNEKNFNGLQAAATASKFSICSSSDYLSTSPRESAITCTTDSTRYSSNVNPSRTTVTFAAIPRPARPPRPPTADSPTLSDSVYLACSNQPYVIVAPPSLKNADVVEAPPKKMLTPSEFFALHVPGIISSLVGSSNGNSGNGNEGGSRKRERERATLGVTQQKRAPSGRARSASLHSRTKSAPLLGSLRAMTRAAKNRGHGENSGESSSGEDIATRVTRHRRSRSASGWAYPDRQRLRKTLAG